MNPLWSHLFLGPVILLLALLYRYNLPSQPNMVYGYRTLRSKKSKAVWDAANLYSANAMIVAAVATIIFQAASIFIWEAENSVIASVIFMLVAILATIPFTEIYIRKHFDEEGRRKDRSSF